jgi:hypothetical protein
MRRRITVIAVVGMLAPFFNLSAYAQTGRLGSRSEWGNWGYETPRNRVWNYCPDCGRPWGPYGGYGMNPEGRWGREFDVEPSPRGRGYDLGPEDSQYGYGPYYPGYEYPPYQRERRGPLDEDEAVRLMESYLNYTGNPNLKVGKIEEKEGFFVGEIVTKKEGSLVERVKIDKRTGWMRFGG